MRSCSSIDQIVVILAMTRWTVSNWLPLKARVCGTDSDDDSLMHAPAGSFQIDRF